MDRQPVACTRCGHEPMADTRLFGLPVEYCEACGYAGVAANGLAVFIHRDESDISPLAAHLTIPPARPDADESRQVGKVLPSAREVFAPIPPEHAEVFMPIHSNKVEGGAVRIDTTSQVVIPCAADCDKYLIFHPVSDAPSGSVEAQLAAITAHGWSGAIRRAEEALVAYCPDHGQALRVGVVHD